MRRKNKKEAFYRALMSLKEKGIKAEISFEELLSYLSSETYENEKTSLEEIFSNEELLIHEIFEVWELKSRGYDLRRVNVLEIGPEILYPIHLKALEVELKLSWEKGKRSWIKKRIKDLRSYLSDPLLPPILRCKIIQMIGEWERKLRRKEDHRREEEGRKRRHSKETLKYLRKPPKDRTLSKRCH